MAKKKSNKKTLKILSLLSVIFGIVAVLFIFAPALKDGSGNFLCSGLNISLGVTIDGMYYRGNFFSFSFINTLGYLLIIIGIVGTIFSSSNSSKLINLISALAFLTGGVLMFTQITFSVSQIPNIKQFYILSDWIYIAGILAIVSGIMSFAKIILD